MESIIDQLIVVSEGFALLGTTWLIWFISGVANNLFSPQKWSWRRTGEDILKTILMVVATLAWVVTINLLNHYTAALGIDISKLLDGASVTGLVVIIAGGSGVYAYKGFRNIIRFFIKDHTVLQKITENVEAPEELDYAEAAEPVKQFIDGIMQYAVQPEESVEAQLEFEEEGGRGAAYSVPIDTYDRFRNTVMGKGYDIDGAYGYQCWDGCALLWQQLGKNLATGNGCAYGCWTLNRDCNKNDQFDLITDVKQIKRGDVLVFRAGEFGHIGFADADYSNPNYIPLLGQNQGGTPKGAAGGAGFNVINMSLVSFLGAFRLKKWASAVPTPAPAPKPQPKPEPESTEDGEDEPSIVFYKKGDQVVPLKKVDYDGRKLRQYDEVYTVMQDQVGDRVVLGARGQIWAAMNTTDIRKV